MLTTSTDSAHILLVEDDTSLAQWIIDYLGSHNFIISHAAQGDTAVDMILNQQPDLVILDLMLPKKNGFDICKEVRPQFQKPILMLTASNEESDEILGLELGATDFVAKPVRPRVLLARIKALLRREEITSPKRCAHQFGRLRVDATSKTVVLDDTAIAVTASEFDLLWILVEHAGEIVYREALLRQLRGIDYDGFDRSIDIAISRLRKKLGDTSTSAHKIKTIRSKGYFFSADAWE